MPDAAPPRPCSPGSRPRSVRRARVVSSWSAAKAATAAAGSSARPVISLDIPAGLPADGGAPLRDAIRADATLTFAGLKRALVMPPGREYAGRVSVIDIGIPASEVTRGITTFVVEDADVARHF